MIPQSAITILAEITPGAEARLQQLLEDAGRDVSRNQLVPFGRLAAVHFARFFIMPASRDLRGQPLPARLMFLADIDGPPRPFLRALCSVAEDGVDTIFSHCAEYPGRAQLLDYLLAHLVPEAATYVNTRGRSVDQVRQEASLREAIQLFLDRSRETWRGADPRRVRTAIQEFVEREPSLAWARRPVPAWSPRYVLGERLHVLLVGIAGVVLFPLILLGLPLYLWLLRQHEKRDQPRDMMPDDALIQRLAAQEDHGVQNPFTSAGLLKPGPFRRFTATLVLWGTNFLTRHLFNRANLLGVKTIHFARWVFLDNKRRVIFASNYDGSLEAYMDDFIDKIAWGLNITFSNGRDYPRTNWLIKDGANDEQTFKRFNLTHQLVTPFWYAAYQGLTALNIDNNARIRAGLYGDMDAAAARAWLRRL
ncbi:MAG: hypothetical protein M3336_03170 [Chloroflexota bacterium]|nr:hypothetical protein [Chloroflexota bacterium]